MKIKKGWKITWITLGSLLGLIILTVGVAMYIIFTPKQLTKVVNSLAGDFIHCDSVHFGNVDFTWVSTFPDAGLEVHDVVLMNHVEGAPSDTLAYINRLTVGIDLWAFLTDDKVIVHQLLVDGVQANLFVDNEGRMNYDIFPSSEDTSSTQLPELMDIREVNLTKVCLNYKDEISGTDAAVDNMSLNLKGKMDGGDGEMMMALAGQKVRLQTTAPTGAVSFQAEVDGLAIDLQGEKQGLSLDATVSVGGHHAALLMNDSIGRPTLDSDVESLSMSLACKGDLAGVTGKFTMELCKGVLETGGQPMVNRRLQASEHKLLTACVPFAVDLRKRTVTVESSEIQFDNYKVMVEGVASMATRQQPMSVDFALKTDGSWQLKPLVELLPENYRTFSRGMDFDGRVSLAATVQGDVSDSVMPSVDAHLLLSGGRFAYPSAMPYTLYNIKGDVSAHMDMNQGGVSSARIYNLTANTLGSNVSVGANVVDLLGNPRVEAKVKGFLPLEDLIPLVPEGVEMDALGDATFDVKTHFTMSQLQQQAYEQMNAMGSLKLENIDLTFDSIHASTPKMDLELQLPTKNYDEMLADVHLLSDRLRMEQGNSLNVSVKDVDISIGVNNLVKETLRAAFGISLGEIETRLDETQVATGGITLAGEMLYDSTETHMLRQLNPRFHFTTGNVVLNNDVLPDALRVPELDVEYDNNLFNLMSAQVQLSHTDCELYGTVENLEDWLADKAMLHGDLNFKSSYTDVDQLMNLFSGIGNDKDSLEAMRREDNVPDDANPFIVPKNVDFTFNTHVQRSVAFGNDLNDVAGSLTIKDGVAILDQMGFVCKAARMQLTAYYKSPRPNHLFTALDFHLLDIQIDELLDMIPTIDTLVPMLSAFNGNANFHLAGETYLDAHYQPKMSTLLGSAAISGKNLVVMESRSLSNIAKLIGMKSWKEKDNKIRIDSMDVEMTCFRKEIEVYPFLLNMRNYHFCVSGKHTLDNQCGYHIELLKHPLLFKVAVDVRGPISDPDISLGKVRYSDIYKPEVKGAAGKKALELKTMIREALEKNVR